MSFTGQFFFLFIIIIFISFLFSFPSLYSSPVSHSLYLYFLLPPSPGFQFLPKPGFLFRQPERECCFSFPFPICLCPSSKFCNSDADMQPLFDNLSHCNYGKMSSEAEVACKGTPHQLLLLFEILCSEDCVHIQEQSVITKQCDSFFPSSDSSSTYRQKCFLCCRSENSCSTEGMTLTLKVIQ